MFSFEQLLIFGTIAYGIWFTISESHLPVWEDLRTKLLQTRPTLTRFIGCPFCMCFWLGNLIALGARADSLLENPSPAGFCQVIGAGLCCSVVAMTMNLIHLWLESRS